MAEAPFASQLEPEQVADIGRMTINFGYVELLLDWLIMPAWGISSEAARRFVSPRQLNQKVSDLKVRLSLCNNSEAKAHLENAIGIIEQIRDDRNIVTHGYWALDQGVGVAVFRGKSEPGQSQNIRPISELADLATDAGNELYAAFDILNGRDPQRNGPDVLAPEKNGTFTVVRKGKV